MSEDNWKDPHRYPKHEGDKGQKWGGECNTTRCTNRNAIFYNMGTSGLYCQFCRDGINFRRHAMPLVVQCSEKPASQDEIEAFKTKHDYDQVLKDYR